MIRSEALEIEFQSGGSCRSNDERFTGVTVLDPRARRRSAADDTRNSRLRVVPERSKCPRGFPASTSTPVASPHVLFGAEQVHRCGLQAVEVQSICVKKSDRHTPNCASKDVLRSRTRRGTVSINFVGRIFGDHA